MNRTIFSLLVSLPAFTAGCHETDGGVVLGGFCQEAADCASSGVCVYGVCVEDDFFQEGSLEGEPHGGGGTNIELMSGCYVLPVETYQITGYHHGSPVGGGKYHAGDDVKGSAGTPIYSVYEGTVKSAGKVSTWGGLVEIEHRNPVDDSTFYSLYGHLRPSSISVSKGQTVAAGQELGVLGTQQENGGWIPHLHFSIYTGTYPVQGVLKGHLADLTGYQDPIPWLEANCETCTCDGTLNKASITNNMLFVAGTVACDAGIDKWSVAVHDTAVHGEYPGEDAIAFAETVDLGPHGFADSDAPVGLWARPIGGEACLLDQRIVTPGSNADPCKPNDHKVCQSGDVYWADSCGALGLLVEECPAPAACVKVSPLDASCQQVPETCGNGAIDPGEDCDGDNLDGASCVSEGHDSGPLKCSAACTLDASGCVDACTDPFTITQFKCASFSSADGEGAGGGELFSVCGTANPQTGFMTIRARKQPNDPNPQFGERAYQVRVSDPSDPACGPATAHFEVSDDSPSGEGSAELDFTFQSSWLPGQTAKAYCVTASTKPGDVAYDANDPGQGSWWWSEKIVLTKDCL